MNLPLQRGEIQQVKAGVRKKRKELKNKEGNREVANTSILFIPPPKFQVLLVFFGPTTQQECERCFVLTIVFLSKEFILGWGGSLNHIW